MAENGNNALGNALSAANAVRGAVKTGKAIAAAAKGGAAGGAIGAAAAFLHADVRQQRRKAPSRPSKARGTVAAKARRGVKARRRGHFGAHHRV